MAKNLKKFEKIDFFENTKKVPELFFWPFLYKFLTKKNPKNFFL